MVSWLELTRVEECAMPARVTVEDERKLDPLIVIV
jgi:hypothetical protein